MSLLFFILFLFFNFFWYHNTHLVSSSRNPVRTGFIRLLGNHNKLLYIPCKVQANHRQIPFVSLWYSLRTAYCIERWLFAFSCLTPNLSLSRMPLSLDSTTPQLNRANKKPQWHGSIHRMQPCPKFPQTLSSCHSHPRNHHPWYPLRPRSLCTYSVHTPCYGYIALFTQSGKVGDSRPAPNPSLLAPNAPTNEGGFWFSAFRPHELVVTYCGHHFIQGLLAKGAWIGLERKSCFYYLGITAFLGLGLCRMR